MPNSVLHLDFETFSAADIRRVGLENYIRHPSTLVTVIAWAFDDEPVQSVVWPNAKTLPAEVALHIEGGGEIRAHNAAFEHAVLNTVYRVPVTVEQMTCTMQKALAYGLPAGLLKAGRALKLAIVKDESKRLLMLQMGRPAKVGPPLHEAWPGKLAQLCAYCEDDVRAERALDKACPDLHPWEKKLSELDLQINRKGVRLDLDAVRALRAAARLTVAAINQECTALTGGAVTAPGSQTARLMAWLRDWGAALPDVSKETVTEVLTNPHRYSPNVHRVLELRQAAARSSVAKLDRMLDVASISDQRARYLLQFYGAGRTGRWSGRLVQPQNLPRTMGVNAEQVIGTAGREPEALGLLWADPMQAISRSLRSCFIAKDDHVLVSLDLAQIEARVLAWLAGQQDVVDTFARGDDVYVLAARKVGSADRQLGKVLTLACGYGMGAAKFRDTAAAAPYYVTLTADEAKRHLTTWRQGNHKITKLWDTLETAAVLSIQNPGTVIPLDHGMAFLTSKGTTRVRKPNGVPLFYHNMRIWQGDLIFDGVNGTTKNWGIEKAYGGRLVENLTQSVARDLMAQMMLDVPDYVPTMSVHDEVVWEVPKDAWDLGMPLLSDPAPAWAKGLPTATDLHVGVRYAK